MMTEPVTAGFLADRLAKASAVPAEQRSADVRAFIETCQLQAELVEELELPATINLNNDVVVRLWSRWTAAPALKLVRSHFISPGPPLMHSPHLNGFASLYVLLRVRLQNNEYLPSNLGHELTELLEGDPSLETFAILAAGLPSLKKDRGWGGGVTLFQRLVLAHVL